MWLFVRNAYDNVRKSLVCKTGFPLRLCKARPSRGGVRWHLGGRRAQTCGQGGQDGLLSRGGTQVLLWAFLSPQKHDCTRAGGRAGHPSAPHGLCQTADLGFALSGCCGLGG